MFKKGFTLVELMIAVVLICMTATVLIGALSTSTFDQSGAQTNMLEHSASIQPEWSKLAVSCARVDTDGNGYVRCTASGVPVIDGVTYPRQTIEAECTGGPTTNIWGGLVNTGCVPIKHGISY